MVPRKLPETISEEDFLKLHRTVRKRHHKIAFVLGFYGCLRVSEVIKLKEEDIDRGQRLIRVRQAKGGRDRNIPIPPAAIRGLSSLPMRCGIRALQIAFKGYSNRVLGKDLHFHCLRHSGATMYLNKKGWNLRQVQQLLGHARPETTSIYTHVSPADLIDKMWGT